MLTHDKKLLTCVEIGKAITSTLNMEQILKIIMQRISELIRAKNWTLYLLDPETQELCFELVVGLEREMLANTRMKLGEGIVGTAALTGEAILVPENAQHDPRFSKRVDDMTGFTTKSLICLPLKVQDSVIGAIEIVNPEDPFLFDESSMPVLSFLADYVSIAITNARNHMRIQTLAITDDVTGFYNTRFLHDYLAKLIEQDQVVSLAFLDLDDFKKVVDTYGHLMGSKMLREVAVVIASQLDCDDRLVRYGGDEYVVIMEAQDKQSALEKMKDVHQEISQSRFLQSEGFEIKITASCGIASYPQDAADMGQLLQMADGALYSSKELGKNSIMAV
jgi:diguanylate cyclase (GGDEF)-like protein